MKLRERERDCVHTDFAVLAAAAERRVELFGAAQVEEAAHLLRLRGRHQHSARRIRRIRRIDGGHRCAAERNTRTEELRVVS